jgi:hypothetical protein
MKYARRHQRKNEVLQVMYQAWLQGRRLTTHDIADRVGLRPSQHLRAILNEMVVEGVLSAFPVPHRPHVTKIVYSMNKRHVETHRKGWMQLLEHRYGKQLELPL